MQIKFAFFVKNIDGDYMHNIDLSKFNIRTDLIIENNSILHNEKEIDNIKITKTIKDGNYITISFEDITDHGARKRVESYLIDALKEIIKLNNINDNASCLVVGLGNIKSTPDSLGVKVLDNITVTSHLYKIGDVDDKYRMVSAISPGVLATTGIESADIITAVIKKTKPDFVIAIDALAARNIERINKTIQITDTGIHPGSGIGNIRVELSKKTLGIPIIAIGVPTVLLSSTIVYDTITYIIKYISYLKENSNLEKLKYTRKKYKNKIKDYELSDTDKENLLGLLGTLDDNDTHNLISEVLDSTELNMIVTPTEIDFLIDKLSILIARSINKSLEKSA